MKVRSGIVELVGNGSATVTATAMDGGSQATCLINVTGGPAALTGDVNGDGVVDVADINVLLNIILGNDSASNYGGRADVNGDGNIDVSDVNSVINIMLG